MNSKKMITRCMMMLLVLTGVLYVNPNVAKAATTFYDSNFRYEVTTGSNVKVIGITASPQITSEIPGTVMNSSTTYTVTEIADEAFSYEADANSTYKTAIEKITTITIPETVTTIGEKAFYKCPHLHKVYLTGTKTISKSAFAYCDELTDVDLGKVETIGDSAFAGCRIAFLTIPDGTKTIGASAFENNKLNSETGRGVEIPYSVTSIGDYAFLNNENLKRIELPNSNVALGIKCIGFNTEDNGNNYTVTAIQVFSLSPSNAKNYYDIYLFPNKGASAMNFINLFEYEENTIISYNGSNPTCYIPAMINDKVITTIGSSFSSLSSTFPATIIIPEGVTTIEDEAFSNVGGVCDNIKKIVLPSTLETIGANTFNDCANLSEVVINGNELKTIGEGAFAGCEKLTSITLPSSVTSVGANAFGYKAEYTNNKYIYTATGAVEITSDSTAVKNYVEQYTKDNPADDDKKDDNGGNNDTPANTPVDISSWTVTGIEAKTYTGKALTQNVTVSKDGKNADVDVKYTNNVNAGTATITISGKGDYTGTITKTFEIKKADQKMAVKASTKTVKLKKVKKSKQTVSNALKVSNAKGKVTYAKVSKGSSNKLTINKSNGKITVKKKSKKGTYKINVKVTAAGDKNYNSASKTLVVKIKVK